ncbi:Sodium-dependent phosphate transport protein 3 [Fukomys damarensis]|uniref:Sodium-dependent phosphate transport protein 3 n=1 Tax=Fukomys damarensis TaxID=885580 RepID=A0A091EEQ3_FUKDA|nr:Sodium-dependent phosphate transport protein 3 [Fukomys damarensis]
MAVITELSSTLEIREFSQHLQVDEKHSPRKVPRFCSIRYGIAFAAHLFNFVLAAQSVILNITMVAMVNSTDHQSLLNNSTEVLPIGSPDGPGKAPTSIPAKAPVYDWSPQTQGIVFSSINYGVLLTMAPGGYVAGRVGARKVAGVALLGSSLLTLCIPLAANLGLVYLIVARIVQGLTQGSGFGGHFGLWQKWAPPPERSRLCSISLSGIILGMFSVILLGGIISQALGWPFVFYVFGGLGCVYSLLWFVLVYDDPVSHPWISISEKEYILSTLNQQNGLLSSLPFIVAWIIGLLGGHVTDFLLTKNFRLVTVRKTVTMLGQLPASAFLVALPYLNSSYITTLTFLTISCGLGSFCQSGIYINALDIAPRGKTAGACSRNLRSSTQQQYRDLNLGLAAKNQPEPQGTGAGLLRLISLDLLTPAHAV